MCLSKVWVNQDGEKKLLLEEVAFVETEGGKAFLNTLFGEQKEVKANIKKIDLLNHNVFLENLSETSQMGVRSVGVVRNKIKDPSLIACSQDLKWQAQLEKAKEEQSKMSELVINPDLSGILDGVEDFSHFLVLYWAHRVPAEARSLIKVHPVGRKDLPLKGIFATCSPARPNPICVTTVRLVERKANVLKVEGLDAVDGSLLIDIKPYVPSYYTASEVKMADWMVQIEKEFAEDSSE